MSKVIITKDASCSLSKEDFIKQVRWLPEVGSKGAEEIWNGTAVEIDLNGGAGGEAKAEIAKQRIDRLVTNKIIVSNPKDGAPMPKQKEAATPKIDDPRIAALMALLQGGLDENRVIELIKTHGGRPAEVQLELRGVDIDISGETVMHYKFPLLVSAIASGVNVMLVGPAGSGKTTAAVKAAEALGLKFYGTSAINSEYKLTGFIDAQGRIVSTAFRKAFEEGGVFLFDEMDASLPGALLAFNAALANDWMDFPDTVVKRHPDFRVVAGCNTYGVGADRQYVGRNQLDAASLDRYAVIDWDYDEALEASFVGAPVPRGAPSPKSIHPLAEKDITPAAHRFLDRVRSVRKAVNELKIRHVVSPRAVLHGSKLLAAGWPQDQVEEAVIWKGLDKDTRSKVAAKAV